MTRNVLSEKNKTEMIGAEGSNGTTQVSFDSQHKTDKDNHIIQDSICSSDVECKVNVNPSIEKETLELVKIMNILVHRFLRICKFNETQISIFQKYLTYGGIELDKNKWNQEAQPEDSEDKSNDVDEPEFEKLIESFFMDHFINDPFYITIEQHREAPYAIKKFIMYLRENLVSEFQHSKTHAKETIYSSSIITNEHKTIKKYNNDMYSNYILQLNNSMKLLDKIQFELIRVKFMALKIPGKYDHCLSVLNAGTFYGLYNNTEENFDCGIEQLEISKNKEETLYNYNEYIKRFNIQVPFKQQQDKFEDNNRNNRRAKTNHDMKIVRFVNEDVIRLKEVKLIKNRNKPKIKSDKSGITFNLVIDSDVKEYILIDSVIIGSFICIKKANKSLEEIENEVENTDLYYVNYVTQILPPFAIEEF